MPRGPRIKSETNCYHIMNRGNGKQDIFCDDEDRIVFMRLLNKCKETENFKLYAYCLMDNHFHLLLTVDDNLDVVMKKLCNGYVRYFNTKYECSGHLFGGRFKSEPVNDDEYFLTVIRYIHNNPEKAGISSKENYTWSSYNEYTGDIGFTDREMLYDMLMGKEHFEEFSRTEVKTECLEYDTSQKPKDDEAIEIIKAVLKVDNLDEIINFDKKSQTDAARLLRFNNLSCRQIERLTGINRGIIQRA